jgi:membrane fusion protein, multidrug efflux system
MKHSQFIGCCISIFAIALLMSVASCKNTEQEATAPPFKTKVVDTTSAVVYSEYSAVIQSQSLIEIRTRISGYIQKIAVNEGEYVKKGDLLFRIDDADYTQNLNAAQAGVQSAKAQMDNASLEVRKLTPLVSKGIISPYELESAKSNQKAAEAQYNQAIAQYNNANINLGYTRITAPVDGVLGRIYIREGSLVGPSNSEPLTNISSDGDVYAYFSFDEKKLSAASKNSADYSGKYDPNKNSIVELQLADGTIYQYKGKLESATGIIDRATGSIQLKVIFPNPRLNILSGSSGVLRFPAIFRGSIVIPQKSTYELQDKIMVYIVNEDNTVSAKNITISGISGNDYVVKDGLSKGDRIVFEGTDKLKEGMKITPNDI